MSDILKWLERQTRPEEMSPEYRQAVSKVHQIEKALNPEIDFKLDAEMGAALSGLADVQYLDGFTRGFRLCAQLFSAAMLAR